MIIKWHLSIGYAGCDIEDTFEIDDGTTDEQIEEAVEEYAFSYMDLCWEKEKCE